MPTAKGKQPTPSVIASLVAEKGNGHCSSPKPVATATQCRVTRVCAWAVLADQQLRSQGRDSAAAAAQLPHNQCSKYTVMVSICNHAQCKSQAAVVRQSQIQRIVPTPTVTA